MDFTGLSRALKREALAIGFDLAGICRAGVPPHIEWFRQWLADGCAGQMHYMTRRADAYGHPDGVLPGVESLLMLGTVYRTEEPAASGPGQGRVARYAWGDDYHLAIRHRLARLAAFLTDRAPGAVVRGVVDTAPLLEREFAQLAGLGWIGKNTLLIHPDKGSWVFLAALLTDVVLEPDTPLAQDRCGACRACLDACPTGALAAPYRLDARKCLSYWTIEAKQSVPEPLRAALGDRVFGCDACQDACPWNRRAASTKDASAKAALTQKASTNEASPNESSLRPRPGMNPLELEELFRLDAAAFRRRFRNSPLARSKRRGLLRNAALVLGNGVRPGALAALAALATLAIWLADAEPLVRGACAWALGRIAGPEAAALLRGRVEVENDAEVRQELLAAIDRAKEAS
jgi:epoxyqueuosine reductase